MRRSASDSDDSSFAGSSPYPYAQSPPLYYVHSPSADSREEEKYSSRATPVYQIPSDSSSHFNRSRSSSASRNSVPFRLSTLGPHDRGRRLNENGWIDYSAIKEEVHYYSNYEDDDDEVEGFTVAFKVFLGIVGFVLICTGAGFAVWGLSRQYEPEVVVESLFVNYFHAGIGQDHTGVPTKLVDLNSTVKVNAYNPAPYFGIHVTSTHVSLLYSEIPVALNQLEDYYLPRKSRQEKSVILKGHQVPLYGASPGLDISRPNFSVPMTLKLDMNGHGNVVWFLVRVKVRRHITCNLAIDSNNNRPIQFPKGKCKSY